MVYRRRRRRKWPTILCLRSPTPMRSSRESNNPFPLPLYSLSVIYRILPFPLESNLFRYARSEDLSFTCIVHFSFPMLSLCGDDAAERPEIEWLDERERRAVLKIASDVLRISFYIPIYTKILPPLCDVNALRHPLPSTMLTCQL